MSVFTRPDSPYYWLWLEGAPKPKVNTKIPIGTGKQKAKNRALAEDVYHHLMADRARTRFGLPAERLRAHLRGTSRLVRRARLRVDKRGTTREVSMLKQLGAVLRCSTQLHRRSISRSRGNGAAPGCKRTSRQSTVRREEAILKHLLTTAVPKYLAANPLTGLKPRPRGGHGHPRADARRRGSSCSKALTDAGGSRASCSDRARHAAAAPSNVAAPHARAGPRRVPLHRHEGRARVKVPISARLRKALDALPSSGPAMFPSYAGQHNNLVVRMFTDACRRAGVKLGRKAGGVSFHCLRHTGASRMLEAGFDVKTVMEIGGWKSLTILQRYLHPTDATKRRAVEAIGRPRHSRSKERKSA
jgi:integrase